MALIKCPECNKEVSNHAKACPNCGYPISEYCVEKENKSEYDVLKFQKDLFKAFNKYDAAKKEFVQNNSRMEPSFYPVTVTIKQQISMLPHNDMIAYRKYIVLLYKIFMGLNCCGDKVNSQLNNIIDVSKLDNDTMFELLDIYYKQSKGKGKVYNRQFYPLFRKFYDINGKEYYSKYKTVFADDLNFFLLDSVSSKSSVEANANVNLPKCPTCNSTNIEKISTSDKIGGAVMFGLLSKTAKSQFKCKNCGYKW